MSEPVYVLGLGQGFTDSWYQLTKEEQDELVAKVNAIDERAGKKWVIACDSRWADLSTPAWFVHEFPSMEAYQQRVKEVDKIDWWRYWKVKTILGTKMDI